MASKDKATRSDRNDRSDRFDRFEGIPSNDTERLLMIADRFGTVDKIPDSMILHTSGDCKTVITKDGTKVSDEILEATVNEARLRAAATKAASGIPENVVTFDVARQMIEEAVQNALKQQTANK